MVGKRQVSIYIKTRTIQWQNYLIVITLYDLQHMTNYSTQMSNHTKFTFPTSPALPTTCTKKQSNNYNVLSPYDSHYLALLYLPHEVILWPQQISPSYMDSVIWKTWLDLILINLYSSSFSSTVEVVTNNTISWKQKQQFSIGYEFCTKNCATKVTNAMQIVCCLSSLKPQCFGDCRWGGEMGILLHWIC
jgi:hypothetical protein